MSDDSRPARDADVPDRSRSVRADVAPASGAPPRRRRSSDDTRLAVEIRGLVERGEMDEARERFGGLVAAAPAPRRRASPISIFATPPKPTKRSRTRSSRSSATSRSYREAWPFEVWFTRILINGCLDRRKARGAPRSLVRAGERGHQRRRSRARRRPALRPIPSTGSSRASGARSSPRPSIGSTAASAPCSCCVTTATARRGKSAR